MEERLRIVLWTLAGGGFCGAVGLWFGALAAAMAWRHGQAGGGRLGRAVADAFTRLRSRPPSEAVAAALVGGVEGAAFLGALGALAGFVAGYSGQVRPATAGMVGVGLLLLAVGAAFFGSLAYGMVRAGTWSLLGVFSGGMAGALVGAHFAQRDGLMYGSLLGALLGLAPALIGVFRHITETPPEEPAEKDLPL